MAIYPSGTLINNRYEVVQGPKEKPSLAGGMGLVYLCVDHAEDGKPVALKTFRPELLSNRSARDRFLREGTTWVELSKHPHIVRCYEVFKSAIGSEVFFALELVAAAEGKADASLRSWLIPNEPLPLEQALLFALHISRGMVHATTKIPGMVHRDLKPENILIGRDGRARVTDFGLASVAQNLGSDWQLNEDKSSSHIRTQLTHGIVGTPMYMAPEQWASEKLDERADIYAFGCILYEMLCGSFVVTGNSIEEIKESHCQGRIKVIPSHLPKQLSSLLEPCLALDRADRYPNWVELEKHIAEQYFIVIGKKVPQLEEEVENTRSDRIAVGWSYSAIGLSYKDIGKFKVASDYFNKVLAISKQENHSELEGAALGNLGVVFRHLGNPLRAVEFFERALSITRTIGDRFGEGAALGNLGLAYDDLSKPHRAIEFHEKRLAINRELGDRYGEGGTLGNLAISYRQLGDPRRAIEFSEQHLAIARELGDRHGEANALGNLAIFYRQLGNPHRAFEFSEEYLNIAREIGDRDGECKALNGLGNTYCQIGNPQQAIKFFEQVLTIVRENRDRRGEEAGLGNLGIAYYQSGDLYRSIEFFEQALAIAREIGDRDGEGRALGSLGNAYAQLNNPRRAIEFFEQHLTIVHEIGDLYAEGTILGNLGLAYSNLGEARQAIKYYERHLLIARKIGDVMGIARTSFNMALILQHDQPSKALKYANDALKLFYQGGQNQYVKMVQELINSIHSV